MDTISDAIIVFHTIFGERVLPVLIIAAAIWFTVSWKPDAGRTLPGRLFVWLIALQVVLGFVQWMYGLIVGRPHYLGFPFILHPLLGLLAVSLAPLAVYERPGSKLSRLGRWKPLLLLALILVIVTGSIITGMAR